MKGYFVVTVGNNNAVFSFSPFQQMKDILDVFQIPYKMYEDRSKIKCKKRLKSNEQKLTKYRLASDKVKIRQFYFTNDIIDKVLDYYNIEYKKMEEVY